MTASKLYTVTSIETVSPHLADADDRFRPHTHLLRPQRASRGGQPPAKMEACIVKTAGD